MARRHLLGPNPLLVCGHPQPRMAAMWDNFLRLAETRKPAGVRRYGGGGNDPFQVWTVGGTTPSAGSGVIARTARTHPERRGHLEQAEGEAASRKLVEVPSVELPPGGHGAHLVIQLRPAYVLAAMAEADEFGDVGRGGGRPKDLLAAVAQAKAWAAATWVGVPPKREMRTGFQSGTDDSNGSRLRTKPNRRRLSRPWKGVYPPTYPYSFPRSQALVDMPQRGGGESSPTPATSRLRCARRHVDVGPGQDVLVASPR